MAVGSGEGAADTGEGEAVHGTEADPPETAWSRGGRTASDLSADAEGENQATEGQLSDYSTKCNARFQCPHTEHGFRAEYV